MSHRTGSSVSECQACRGTGYVAGAQPIRPDLMCLTLHPARYVEAQVARGNRESELNI
jgi:hypothetical protein